MDHVRGKRFQAAGDLEQIAHITGRRDAGHGHAFEQGEVRRELGKDRVGARAACRRIRDHADAMAARYLFAREVNNVTEEAAKRRPQDVDDRQGVFGITHVRPGPPRRNVPER